MYQVFDQFLRDDRWHKGGVIEDRRFYAALSQVVSDPAFSPQAMGECFKAAGGLEADYLEQIVSDYVGKAETIRDYLQVARQVQDLG